jgi:hypothetical protein
MKTTIRLFPTFFMFLGLSAMPIVHAVSPPPDGGYPGANTAEGQNALFSLTTGSYNTAVGWLSLRSDTTGSFNTAIGAGALAVNSADDNTATGVGALLNNSAGAFNTANGVLALFHNTEGDFNTGIGSFVLFNNTTGAQNMAMGDSALLANTSGSQNIAIGVSALRNSNASHNVAIGKDALLHNNTGIYNVAIGESALQSSTSANGNTAIGNDAGVNITGGSNICIGSEVAGDPGDNNTIRIGDNLPTQTGQAACYVGGIYGQLYGANGTQCYVDPNGKLSVFFSARRFKTDIADIGDASEVLLALRPVTFHYKPEFDRTGTRQFGLVAEEVAAVNPDLVTHDAKGQLATVRYESVNALLLNEFLKQHKAFIEEQHKVEKLDATVAELSSKLERIAARMEMNDSAARAALSNQ